MGLVKLLVLVIRNSWLQWRLMVSVGMVGEVTILRVTGVSVSRASGPILNTGDSCLLTRDTILSSGAANMGGDRILRGLRIGLGIGLGIVWVCLI